jgi:hypothetical protein
MLWVKLLCVVEERVADRKASFPQMDAGGASEATTPPEQSVAAPAVVDPPPPIPITPPSMPTAAPEPSPESLAIAGEPSRSSSRIA